MWSVEIRGTQYFSGTKLKATFPFWGSGTAESTTQPSSTRTPFSGRYTAVVPFGNQMRKSREQTLSEVFSNVTRTCMALNSPETKTHPFAASLLKATPCRSHSAGIAGNIVILFLSSGSRSICLTLQIRVAISGVFLKSSKSPTNSPSQVLSNRVTPG